MDASIPPVSSRSYQSLSWGREFLALLRLGWPLIIAQVASILLFTTDVVMMGWLGPTQLAAGTLATSLLHPVFLGGLGVVTATAPMIAQAIGAREGRSVRRTVRQGFWASALLTALLVPVIWQAKHIFLWLKQPEPIVLLAESYLHFAIGAFLPGLLIVALRSLLQARGSTTIILLITVAGVFVNAGGNYVLMFGKLGLPALGLVGAGISTSIVNWVMFLLALAYVVFHRRYKRYYVLVRLWRPDWPRFVELFRIGIPIGLTLMSEVGMFGLAVIMMGWLGTNEVAAHAVALQSAALAFMVPLGLSQATTVRVGLAVGAGSREGVKKAGWASLALTLIFMSATCLLFLNFPDRIVALYLDPTAPENQTSLVLAASYLSVAALFQLVDGGQVIMGAALRGMSDTRLPMAIAMVGYWVFGLSTAYFCGFVLGWRGVGIWTGLAAGLAFVAIVLGIRFALRERLDLMGRARRGAALASST